jgi:protein-tyrosine-phosphatase
MYSPLAESMVLSDLIFAMDFENLAELQTLYPAARNKIFLLSRYAEGRQRNREIPDPYFGDIETTRRCYSVLRACINNLASKIGYSHDMSEPMSHSR